MIRLGVVGYGSRASHIAGSAFREVCPDLRVVGVVDPDEAEVRERLPESDRDDVVFYRDLKEMVVRANLDGLFIGTRCNLHAPIGVEAAAYDIPVFLEKPVAITMEQAQALETAFENARCPVVVSFPLRVSPLCLKTRDFLKDGAVGEPVHIAALNYVPYGHGYWERGYRDYSITGGLLLQKATHDLDYMAFLMNSPVVRVAAMGTFGRVFGGTKAAGLRCSTCDEADTCPESPENRARSGLPEAEDHLCTFSVDCGSPETGTNEDASSVLLEFASGVHGVYTQVFFSRRDAERRGAVVSGYHGTLDFDWYRNDLKYVRHFEQFSDKIVAGDGQSHFGGDYALSCDFIDIIRGKGHSRTPIETGIQSAYSCLAARESIALGKFVPVRQVGAANHE